MTEFSPAQLAALADAIASRLADRLENQSALLDYSGLSQWLSCSIPSVERLKRQGRIPFVEIGRRVLFDRTAVLSALSKVSSLKTDKTAVSPEKCEVVSE